MMWALLWGDSRRVRLKPEDRELYLLKKFGLYPVGRGEPLESYSLCSL